MGCETAREPARVLLKDEDELRAARSIVQRANGPGRPRVVDFRVGPDRLEFGPHWARALANHAATVAILTEEIGREDLSRAARRIAARAELVRAERAVEVAGRELAAAHRELDRVELAR